MNNDLVQILADLDEAKALTLVRRALDSGISPPGIVEQCRRGVEAVGRRFALGEYFLSDLVMSAIPRAMAFAPGRSRAQVPTNSTGGGKLRWVNRAHLPGPWWN
ncbi:MAG: B12-binding domain-containing protein [Peptococcaceae bacterium]|jgi:methanogenic corrinoid protein MtbC1|nr:B12-binding domain-containing protein [Peptococcaceae bacterium]